jgi:hypothetical protein
MRGDIRVNRLEGLLTMLDYTLNTKKKRHIAGGILMSISVLFGGLAVTVMTLKMEEESDEQTFIE